MIFIVRAYLKKGVKNQKSLADKARRIADLMGRPGIIAKRGQSDTVIASQGFLRTTWPNRQLAKKYQEMIEKRCGKYIKTQRFLKSAD